MRFLLLALFIFSVSCDLASVLSDLSGNYTYSDYLSIGYACTWWRYNTTTGQLDFAVLGRVMDDGWVSVGFGGNGSSLNGMVNVLGNSAGEFGVYQMDGNGTSAVFRKVTVESVQLKSISQVINFPANFTFFEFSWDTTVKNHVLNLTAGNVGINMVYSLNADLKVIASNNFLNKVNLLDGSNATPYRDCDFFRNCHSNQGSCVDKFMCQCKENWMGPTCTTPAPVPPPPPPTPEPPTNFEFRYDFKDTLLGVILRWNISEENLLISVEAQNHFGYIGFGINNLTTMIGADAVIGWIDKAGEQHIGAYNLSSKRLLPHVVPIPEIYHITNARVFYYNGSTTIMFERKLITGQHHILNNNTIILASVGATPDPDIQHHERRVDPCCPSVNFSSGAVEKTFDFRLLHGIIMAISWGIIFPFGVLAARHLKGRGNLWFNIHRPMQLIGFVAIITAAVIIIYQTAKIQDAHFQVGHPLGGLILLCLSFIQVVFAAIRPHKDETKYEQSTIRKIWEGKHVWLGRFLVFASWIIIIFGMCKYTGSDMPQCITAEPYRIYFILYFAWLAILIITILALEIRKCTQRNKEKYVPIH